MSEQDRAVEARMGARAITRTLAARVPEVRGLAERDYFVTIGCDIEYDPRTSVLRAVTDDREVITFDVEPLIGWVAASYGERIGTRFAVPLMVTRERAESMFDWPIYRAAMGMLAPDEETVAVEAYPNAAFAQGVCDVWNANRLPVGGVEQFQAEDR